MNETFHFRRDHDAQDGPVKGLSWLQSPYAHQLGNVSSRGQPIYKQIICEGAQSCPQLRSYFGGLGGLQLRNSLSC